VSAEQIVITAGAVEGHVMEVLKRTDMAGRAEVYAQLWAASHAHARQPNRDRRSAPDRAVSESVSEGGLEPSERRFLDQRVSSTCPGFPCQSGKIFIQLLTVDAGYNGWCTTVVHG